MLVKRKTNNFEPYNTEREGNLITKENKMKIGTAGTIKWTYDGGTLILEPVDGKEGVCKESLLNAFDDIFQETETIETKGILHFTGTSLKRAFYEFSNLKTANLSAFETSQATNMSYMFDECSSLTSLDISSFDTGNVRDMHLMFFKCSSLTSLDVSNFDTSDVIDMDSMFRGCYKLTSLDVSSFDTNSVRDMHLMFSDCHSLTSLDLSNFDTSKAEDMSYMFQGCTELTSLDISNFNFENVSDAGRLFYLCGNLVDLDVPDDIKGEAEKLTTIAVFNDLFPENTANQNIGAAHKIFEVLERTNGLHFTKEREQLNNLDSEVVFDDLIICVAKILARKEHKKLLDIFAILNDQRVLKNIESRSVDDIVSTFKNNGTVSSINAYLNGVPLEDILA